MRASVSRVGLWEQCPYRYKLRYLDGLIAYPNLDPDNPLWLGTALHRAMETDVETATAEYYSQYPIISDEHINESMKIEHVVGKMTDLVPDGDYEVRISSSGEFDFVGFIDLLAPVGEGLFDMYDFKYSNHATRYESSPQLHVYKFFYERMTGHLIRDMYFVFAPKVAVRQKKNETLSEFRVRMLEVLSEKEVTKVKVKFNEEKVHEFLRNAKLMATATEFPKMPSKLCDWCEYQRFCESDGEDDLDVDWVASRR